MKTRIISLITLGCALVSLQAAETGAFDEVGRADAERIAATIAGDLPQLSNRLAHDLCYAHADGRVQTKQQFIAAAAANTTKYVSVAPRDVVYQQITDGAVAMRGVARIVVAKDGRSLEFTLRFLAVWRNESGTWRLAAYQSTALPEQGAPGRP